MKALVPNLELKVTELLKKITYNEKLMRIVHLDMELTAV